MDKSPRSQEEEEMVGRERGGFSVVKLLIVDALPLGILTVVVTTLALAGGAIMQKIEENDEDTAFLDFWKSVEYCMTLLTTVGYGHITPVTQAGRLATVLFGVIGIPLFFALIFKIGAIFAKVTCGLLALLGLKTSINTTRYSLDSNSLIGDSLAMVLSICIFLAYLVGTTFLIKHFMNWDLVEMNPTFIDALYFNFVTLSTTGFGDMVPPLDDLYFTYLIAGLALVFMSIIMVKNFTDHLLHVLLRKLRII